MADRKDSQARGREDRVEIGEYVDGGGPGDISRSLRSPICLPKQIYLKLIERSIKDEKTDNRLHPDIDKGQNTVRSKIVQ